MADEPSFVGRIRTTLEKFGCCVVVPALRSGLTEMEAAKRSAWGLGLLSSRLPPLGGLRWLAGRRSLLSAAR